ncbi:MAG: hypothetical protein ACPLZB_01780, partial [Caldisericaceae bacterium]
MKEKISEYLDGRVNKEEMNKFFEENPEEYIYYEQLTKMKSVLSEMKTKAPDITGSVLASTRKTSLSRKLSIAISIAAVVLVSGFLVKAYVFKPEMNLQMADKSNPQLKSFAFSPQKPSINIEISKSSEALLMKILKANGTIISTEKRQETGGT